MYYPRVSFRVRRHAVDYSYEESTGDVLMKNPLFIAFLLLLSAFPSFCSNYPAKDDPGWVLYAASEKRNYSFPLTTATDGSRFLYRIDITEWRNNNWIFLCGRDLIFLTGKIYSGHPNCGSTPF